MFPTEKLSLSSDSSPRGPRSGVIGSTGRLRSYFGAAIVACSVLLGAGGVVATASAIDHFGFGQGAQMAVLQFAVARTLDSIGASSDQEAKAHDIVAAKFAKVVGGVDQLQALREHALGIIAAPSFDRDAAETLRSEAFARMDAESKLALAAVADIVDLLAPDQRVQLAAHLESGRPMGSRPPGFPAFGSDRD